MTAVPRMPGLSPLPPECRGSSFSFAPEQAGDDCCHCAEYGLLRDKWLDHPGDLDAFHALMNHIHTCPICAAVAVALPLFSQREQP